VLKKKEISEYAESTFIGLQYDILVGSLFLAIGIIFEVFQAAE
jgi:hypothetical protein